eukprot:jgi/Astpho2/5551/Aster-02811
MQRVDAWRPHLECSGRVPTQLASRGHDIVQWLLDDVQTRVPGSVVSKVVLLYSVGKEVKVHQKGGEADDALLRALLDFHSSQLAANRRGLAVLLSGDADFCNVLDVMRVAGHKIMLYHSPAVARNLLSNCDLHEAWLDFLVRKLHSPAPSLRGVSQNCTVVDGFQLSDSEELVCGGICNLSPEPLAR